MEPCVRSDTAGVIIKSIIMWHIACMDYKSENLKKHFWFVSLYSPGCLRTHRDPLPWPGIKGVYNHTQPFNFLFLFIGMGVLPECMFVYHMSAVPTEARRGCWVPWLELQMLSKDPMSSRKAVRAPNHWAISPATQVFKRKGNTESSNIFYNWHCAGRMGERAQESH